MRHGIADAYDGIGCLGFYSLPVTSRCIAALPAFPSHHSTYRSADRTSEQAAITGNREENRVDMHYGS